MTIFLIILALFTVALLWYALWGRAWLKTKSWANGFFAYIEPVEIALFKKSETLLVARLLSGIGFLLTFLTQIGSIDITPILPLVPEKYATVAQASFGLLPLLISGLGFIVERLRNMTTKPIELVAVPDKTVAESPKLTEAVAMADATKVEAVQAVVQAKAA
jgi:hypothetical protein